MVLETFIIGLYIYVNSPMRPHLIGAFCTQSRHYCVLLRTLFICVFKAFSFSLDFHSEKTFKQYFVFPLCVLCSIHLTFL